MASHPDLAATVLAALLFLITATLCQAQDYLFPFVGEDLRPGERIFTGDHAQGIQGEGEDIGALRYLGDGAWHHLKDDVTGGKNSDFIVYNKPVYAISDGTIVGCWRRAPENSDPPAHHTKFTEGFIPGGGNMLFVDQPDGKRVLYAHMKPDTIPDSLCPNNAPLLPRKMTIPEGDAFVMLDPADQIAIRKGDFLGRVGNSGSSSEPHLHIHAQNGGMPAIMQFEEGLYKPYQAGSTKIRGGWASFAGQEVPDGEVLIRPPRTDPYRMVDFESYWNKGKRWYAGVFDPGAYVPMTLFKSNWQEFLAGWQAIEKKGYRMQDLEIHRKGEGLHYVGVFEPGVYAPMALFKSNWQEFLTGWRAIEQQGYRMKDLEIYKVGRRVTYAGVFEPGTHGPMALFKSDWESFLAGWQAIERQGYRMKDFEAYYTSGSELSELHYAGIFEPGTYAPMALFKSNWQEFLTGWRAIEQQGYRMKDLEIYKVDRRVTYAGIFWPGEHNPAALFMYDWDTFLEGWQHLE